MYFKWSIENYTKNASYLLIWLSFLWCEHLESTLQFFALQKKTFQFARHSSCNSKLASLWKVSFYISTYIQTMPQIYNWDYSINVIFPTMIETTLYLILYYNWETLLLWIHKSNTDLLFIVNDRNPNLN